MATRKPKKKSTRKPKAAPVKAETAFLCNYTPGVVACAAPVTLPPEVLAQVALQISQAASKAWDLNPKWTNEDFHIEVDNLVKAFVVAISHLASQFLPPVANLRSS
jgi:hypothetical protein